MQVQNVNIPFMDYLINMKGPCFFSPLNEFGLKSILSDINMATPACFQISFTWKVFLHILS